MKRIITHSIKLLTAVTLLAFAGGASAHDDHELIELVMKKGHKGKTSLVAKVKAGKNTAAELKELHDMYVKMAKTKAGKIGTSMMKALSSPCSKPWPKGTPFTHGGLHNLMRPETSDAQLPRHVYGTLAVACVYGVVGRAKRRTPEVCQL